MLAAVLLIVASYWVWHQFHSYWHHSSGIKIVPAVRKLARLILHGCGLTILNTWSDTVVYRFPTTIFKVPKTFVRSLLHYQLLNFPANTIYRRSLLCDRDGDRFVLTHSAARSPPRSSRTHRLPVCCPDAAWRRLVAPPGPSPPHGVSGPLVWCAGSSCPGNEWIDVAHGDTLMNIVAWRR